MLSIDAVSGTLLWISVFNTLKLDCWHWFGLIMKGKNYCYCLKIIMLCGSEIWCSKKYEKAILTTEIAVVRSMHNKKIVDKKNTEEQINMLRLKATVDVVAKANGVRLRGY